MDDLDVGGHPAPEPGDEPLVLLDRDDPPGAGGEPGRQDAPSGADLDDEVLRPGIDGGDDLAQDALVRQEMLAEGVAAGLVHGSARILAFFPRAIKSGAPVSGGLIDKPRPFPYDYRARSP